MLGTAKKGNRPCEIDLSCSETYKPKYKPDRAPTWPNSGLTYVMATCFMQLCQTQVAPSRFSRKFTGTITIIQFSSFEGAAVVGGVGVRR